MSPGSAFGLMTRQDVTTCVSKLLRCVYCIVSSVSTVYCTYAVFVGNAWCVPRIECVLYIVCILLQ